MGYSDEVERLAETLKSSGLAASMEDALERAQSMLGKKEEKREESVKEEPVEKKIDISQTTLGDVKNDKKKIGEPAESAEEEKELKKEDVFTDNHGNGASEESSQNKMTYAREKKVDLSEVFNVNK